MTIAKVEALVRNITLHRRLPFTCLTVSAAAHAWRIDVRDEAGATLSLTVAGSRPLELRAAILQHLEAALEDAAATR